MTQRTVRIPDTKFTEHVYPYMGQYIAVDKPLAAVRTPYQELELFWNSHLGNVLVIDGIVQHTDRDEFAYAELCAHVPLCCTARPAASVLIIGGGDLGVMEEVLKHGSVTRCDLVDIDAQVIEFAKQHMTHVNRECWRDERATITIADGLEFMRRCDRTYDAILVDGTDPDIVTAPNTIHTEEFFRLARSRIADGGFFAIGCDMPFHHPQAVAPMQRWLRPLFATCGAYRGTVPTFLGGDSLFAYGCAGTPAPAPERLPAGLRYLNPATLAACFALPEFIRRLVDLEDLPEYEWRHEDHR